MLKKIATSLIAATALGAATLAGGATAAAAVTPTTTPTTTPAERTPSGPITAMSWHHSGFYANGQMCTVQLVLLRGAGAATMPRTGPCYSSAQGWFFYYWS